MIEGKKYIGLRVDIWSAGVILYAMICGYLPFDDPETQLLYKKIMSGDYTIPSHVSPEGRQLIKAILNTDPDARYTIEQIRSHPWYKLYPSNDPQGIIVGHHKVNVDEQILAQTVSYGYDVEEVRKNLVNNKHNKMTTLYYLLLLKAVKGGYESSADINNPGFVPELLFPDRAPKGGNVSQPQSRSESTNKPREMSETRIPLDSSVKKKEEAQAPKEKEREREKKHSKYNYRQGVDKPSEEFVTKTHQKIEDRTKKPNLARLNNTTIDGDNSIIGNRLKSPNVSISPAPRKEPIRDVGTSADIDNIKKRSNNTQVEGQSNPTKTALMNKIREINEKNLGIDKNGTYGMLDKSEVKERERPQSSAAREPSNSHSTFQMINRGRQNERSGEGAESVGREDQRSPQTEPPEQVHRPERQGGRPRGGVSLGG